MAELSMDELKKNKYTLVVAVSKVARCIAEDLDSSEQIYVDKPVLMALDAIKNEDYKIYMDDEEFT